MFALPALIKYHGGKHEFHDGIIVSLPLELRTLAREQRYLRVDKPGWHTGDFNYQIYCQISAQGDMYVFPGLLITGAPRVTKRFHGYTAELSREQVEKYASGVLTMAARMRAAAEADLNLLVHDLRGLSSGIYNSAIAAQKLIEVGNYEEAINRIETVIHSQNMLKMRTDALDFVGNPASIITTDEVPIYKKVDKVVRCFRDRAHTSGKPIYLKGTSFGKSWGPDVFELVPYTLIDNAIKYSPRGSAINVEVTDTNGVTLEVRSFGPRIDDEEKADIFAKGARGKHAIGAGIAGSGVGLHIAKKIAEEHFHGAMEVEQSSSPQQFEDGSFYFTVFRVRLPIEAAPNPKAVIRYR